MKKVLSFVLVLSLVLGSFSMAFAATPAQKGLSDIAGNANEDAIQVANDLGIITGNPDGTFLPAKAVNRAEFAAMITRALAVPDSALTSKTTKFKDTTGYGWAVPYLAFCESKGIMLGDGNGNAMPGRTINTNEAMTMVLRAVGYTANSSELVGAWPSNYVTVAQNNSLYDDVAKVSNVDKANAAQIIYNALTVQKVSVNNDGETKYLTVKENGDTVEANLLNTGLGCETIEDAILGITAGVKYDDAKINVSKNLGAYGTAYTKDDEVVAFTKDSTALTGKVDGDKFEVGNTEYSFSGTNTAKNVTATAIENGAATGTTPTVEAYAKAAEKETITLNVDLTGKTIKEVYNMVAWNSETESAVVTSADLEDLEDNELLGLEFAEDDDKNIDTNAFELIGVKSLKDIKKDNVVALYADGKTIRKVAVGTEVVTGKVTEYKADDYVIVNGKKYEQSDVKGADKLPDLDKDVTMKLDASGDIYEVKATGGTADKFAVVTAFNAETAMDNAKAKMYTSDDSTKTMNFVDKDDVEWTTGAGSSTTGAIETLPILVGYGLDKDGYVDTLDASTKTSATNAKLQSTKVLVVDGKYVDVASDAVVFTKDGTKYDMTTLGNVDNKENLASGSAFQYIMNDDDEVAAILIDKAYDSKNADDVFAVINDVTLVKDGDDTVQKLTGFVNGKDYSKVNVGTNVTVKDFMLYKITENADGKIKLAAEATGKDIVTSGAVVTNGGVDTDRNVLTMNDGSKFTVADDAVVYEAVMKDGKVDYYKVSKFSSIRKDYTVYLYDTKDAKDQDGVATVVIFADK